MYEVGDAVRLSWSVLDDASSLIDATVTATLVPPAGASSTPVVEHLSLGTYTVEFTPTLAGRYVLRWQATGAAESSQTDVVNVAPALDPVDIISLDEAKAFLNKTDAVEDDELRQFVAAASRVVEDYTGEVVARRTVVEDHFVGASGAVLLRPPVESVTSATTVDAATTYDAPTLVDGFTGAVTVAATGWVRITYVAGRAEIPENVRTATAIIAAHLWTTQRPASANAPGFGGFEASPATPGRGYLIPNQAAQLLGGKAPNRP